MADGRAAYDPDRLPWLTDERAPRRRKGSATLLPWALLAALLVAGASYWLGVQSVANPDEFADILGTSPPEATVRLPEAVIEPPPAEVRPAPMPEAPPIAEPAPVPLPRAEPVRPPKAEPARRAARAFAGAARLQRNGAPPRAARRGSRRGRRTCRPARTAGWCGSARSAAGGRQSAAGGRSSAIIRE